MSMILQCLLLRKGRAVEDVDNTVPENKTGATNERGVRVLLIVLMSCLLPYPGFAGYPLLSP